jgi:hypothetical protein
MNKLAVTIVSLLLLFNVVVHGYPQGADPSACGSQTPSHGVGVT